MTIQELVKLVMDNGMSIVLVGYFIFKDYKFNESILAVMGEIKEVLAELKTWHSAEDSHK